MVTYSWVLSGIHLWFHCSTKYLVCTKSSLNERRRKRHGREEEEREKRRKRLSGFSWQAKKVHLQIRPLFIKEKAIDA
jgi:hypothetical protein